MRWGREERGVRRRWEWGGEEGKASVKGSAAHPSPRPRPTTHVLGMLPQVRRVGAPAVEPDEQEVLGAQPVDVPVDHRREVDARGPVREALHAAPHDRPERLQRGGWRR